jgi:2-amino-4-hydroxy-6-hydroxymethyldihydropteridine diphosphokinase
MTLHRVCLSLGSNIDPAIHLPAAVRELKTIGELLDVSRVWQSPAIGAPEQPDYCNMCVLLLTAMEAERLIDADGPLREIESRLGRVRSPGQKGAPRTIDIDLTLSDDQDGTIGRKRVPDPDLFERSCIAVPLSELQGIELPPASGSRLAELAARLLRHQPLTGRADIDALIANARSASA